MYCKNCGSVIDDNVAICPHCRTMQTSASGSFSAPPKGHDDGGLGWGILGFFIPLVGLILFLIWRYEKPNTAKAVGKGALIGVIVGVAFSVLWTILFSVGTMSAISAISSAGY